AWLIADRHIFALRKSVRYGEGKELFLNPLTRRLLKVRRAIFRRGQPAQTVAETGRRMLGRVLVQDRGARFRGPVEKRSLSLTLKVGRTHLSKNRGLGGL